MTCHTQKESTTHKVLMNNTYNSIYFPIRIFGFYWISLLLWRVLFIYFNEGSDYLQVIKSSFKLDMSMIGGVFLISAIPYWLYMAFGKPFLMKITKIINIILWIFVSIVEFSSILLYKEWGTTLDNRAINYLLHPQEAWASVKDFVPFSAVFFGLLIFVSGLKRLFLLFDHWQPVKSYFVQSIIFLVLTGPVAFLILRGGWQKIPIKPSDAFYSQDMKQNFAATNKVWYFLYSMKKSGNINTVHSEQEIKKYARQYNHLKCIQSPKDSTWIDKNIVLIITEGWSADMVAYLYSKETITPFFDSLSQHSIRFTNAFSTGFRTDQGLTSILSGVPSMQSVNVPNVLDKVQSLPSLPLAMRKSGRNTSFIYGGDLNFSNLYNYLTVMGYQKIIRDKDFDPSQMSTDWGVPDHITVGKALEVISSEKVKFFSTILLLSSHSPFEIPVPNAFKGKSIIDKYKSSVMYSDYALKLFFNDAKTKPWFENTVFIITSDHGSTHSGWAKVEDHNRFRIPLIVYDPAQNQKDSIIQAPTNHFDLPLSICQMTSILDTSFLFSRNIFCNDLNQKAYWNVDVAFGKYGLKYQEITHEQSTNSVPENEPLLFLDMVKSWFNQLK
jgi:phosphoglycerol transferase MdoB-like AlkP superfamily enzyme